ncbi:minor capsid protein [Capybara microvirus Cap1_SP_222]|nr:minor capsid protein [Capybara microvirus Cap1_SP_222]
MGDFLLGSLISTIGNAFGIGSSNQANMELAKYQNEQNIKFWQMNNEYNTPLAQRARMEEAGYNPNLFYGQGTPGNSPSPVKAERATVQPFQMADFGRALYNDAQLELATRQVDANINRTNAQTLAILESIPGKTADSAIKRLNASWLTETFDGRVESVRLKNDQISLHNNAERIKQAYLPDFQKAQLMKLNQTILNLHNQYNLTSAKILEAYKNIDYKNALISKVSNDMHMDRAKVALAFTNVAMDVKKHGLDIVKWLNSAPNNALVGPILHYIGRMNSTEALKGLLNMDDVNSYVEGAQNEFLVK